MHYLWKKMRVVCPWLLVLVVSFTLTACQSSEEKAQSHYENGLKLVEQNDIVKAKLEFRNALKLNDKLTPALYSLGQIEFEQKNFSAAIKMFLAVAAADPEHLDARVDAGRIYLLAGQRDQAEKYADEAYAIDSKNISVLAIKGAIEIQKRSFNKAIGFANAALEIDPNYSDALIVLAAERMASSDPKGALVHLEKSILHDEGNIGLQLFKMRVLEALDDEAGIEKVLIRLASLYPENLEINNNLAKWYIRAKKIDAAEKVVRQFQAKNPKNEQAGFNLVAFLKGQRGDDEAENGLQALIDTGGEGVFNYKLAYAELIFSNKENERGVNFLKQLIDETGESENGMRARVFLAQRMVAQQNQDEASKLVEVVLAADDKNVDALLIRATISTIKNNFTSATDDLRLALSEEPRSAKILQALATVYERSGKVDLAEESLAKAVAIQEFKPGMGLNLAQFLLRYGKSDRAETVLQGILEKSPANESALKQLARIRLGRGDWQGATEVATTLSKTGDQNKVLVERIRARALAGQNKVDESIELLQSSLTSAPDDKTPMSDLFRLYVRLKKYDDAEKLVTTSLQSDGDKVIANVRLGSLYRLKNDMEEAESFFKKAVEEDATGVKGLYALAQFYFSNKRFEDAESTIRVGLERQNNNPTMQLLLASILEKLNKIDEAILVYEEMYKAEPRSLVVANNLASLLSEYKENPENLERAYEIAYSRFRNSNTPQFQDTLGWIYVLRGQFGEAVSVLRKASESLPTIGVIHYHLGMAYKGLERTDLAIASLKKAESLTQNTEFNGKEVMKKSLQELLEKSEAPKDKS